MIWLLVAIVMVLLVGIVVMMAVDEAKEETRDIREAGKGKKHTP